MNAKGLAFLEPVTNNISWAYLLCVRYEQKALNDSVGERKKVRAQVGLFCKENRNV
jgi:hypothetical protein